MDKNRVYKKVNDYYEAITMVWMQDADEPIL